MAQFPDENWSAVACRAFEIRVVELHGMNSTTDEGKAIARLKASKMRAIDRLFRQGEAAGAEYVLQKADFMELERLAQSYDHGTLDLECGDYSFRSLAYVMRGGDGSESGLEGFMRKKYGDDIDQPKWMEGFVEGVIAKYHEIGSQLD